MDIDGTDGHDFLTIAWCEVTTQMGDQRGQLLDLFVAIVVDVVVLVKIEKIMMKLKYLGIIHLSSYYFIFMIRLVIVEYEMHRNSKKKYNKK